MLRQVLGGCPVRGQYKRRTEGVMIGVEFGFEFGCSRLRTEFRHMPNSSKTSIRIENSVPEFRGEFAVSRIRW